MLSIDSFSAYSLFAPIKKMIAISVVDRDDDLILYSFPTGKSLDREVYMKPPKDIKSKVNYGNWKSRFDMFRRREIGANIYKRISYKRKLGIIQRKLGPK